ncbi:MAG TPA: hypothetical protein PLO51_02395 [Candidatus Micrarchaeota archaeon]|nr:hypothetical protein [Candidatus Micrarchaeota archaeon]
MSNKRFAGYVGFDLLFAFLAIATMLVFSTAAISQKTAGAISYFSAGTDQYSLLMASDYVVKFGLGGESNQLARQHVFSVGNSGLLSSPSGSQIDGLAGYRAYGHAPPTLDYCIARIVVLDYWPQKIYICK